MIRISQIDDKFSIYKGNIVVLLGIGSGTKQLIYLMHYHKIDIHYLCDNNKDNWGKVIDGIPVISPQHLQQLVQGENSRIFREVGDIVLQIAVNNTSSNIENQLKSIGVSYVVSYNETHNILSYIIKLNLLKKSKLFSNDIKDIECFYQKSFRHDLIEYLVNCQLNNTLIVCSPPKTGNTTLRYTFLNQKIHYKSLTHTPTVMDNELLKYLPNKIKIITATRDPIIQNLSCLYQQISVIKERDRKWDYDLSKETTLFENGGDANKLFKIWIDNFGKTEKNLKDKYYSTFDLNCFFDSFKENILDLSKYPFDKEKGYTIIKEGNIEVFVYQLERMNDIVTEMSDWIGQTPFDKWVMGNEASGKWIANSYKQAQKEITFSQEYFDRCYNDPWVQHFYSQEDIEKFKTRWRPHIK